MLWLPAICWETDCILDCQSPLPHRIKPATTQSSLSCDYPLRPLSSNIMLTSSWCSYSSSTKQLYQRLPTVSLNKPDLPCSSPIKTLLLWLMESAVVGASLEAAAVIEALTCDKPHQRRKVHMPSESVYVNTAGKSLRKCPLFRECGWVCRMTKLAVFTCTLSTGT